MESSLMRKIAKVLATIAGVLCIVVGLFTMIIWPIISFLMSGIMLLAYANYSFGYGFLMLFSMLEGLGLIIIGVVTIVVLRGVEKDEKRTSIVWIIGGGLTIVLHPLLAILTATLLLSAGVLMLYASSKEA